MDDAAVRFILIAGVIAIAGGVAYFSRRAVSYHPPLDIVGAGFQPGLVLFTSTECQRCKEVLAIAKTTGVSVREVTYELESALQEQLGVIGVPLTLVIDRAGRLTAQFAGLVKPGRLSRAVSRAGL